MEKVAVMDFIAEKGILTVKVSMDQVIEDIWPAIVRASSSRLMNRFMYFCDPISWMALADLFQDLTFIITISHS